MVVGRPQAWVNIKSSSRLHPKPAFRLLCLYCWRKLRPVWPTYFPPPCNEWPDSNTPPHTGMWVGWFVCVCVCVFGREWRVGEIISDKSQLDHLFGLLPGGPTDWNSQHICVPPCGPLFIAIMVDFWFQYQVISPVYLSINYTHGSNYKRCYIKSVHSAVTCQIFISSGRDSGRLNVYIHLLPAKEEKASENDGMQDSAHIFTHNTGSVSHLPLWPQTAHFQPTSSL